MTHVATLIAAPGSDLSSAAIDRVRSILPNTEPPRWLSPDTAADVPFAPSTASGNARWVEAAQAVLKPSAVDVVVQPRIGRRKRLLMTDMDSTVIEQECIDELADAVGLRDQVAAVTERAMRGEIAFEQSLRERVALLRGLPVERAVAVVTERISLMPGARTLVRTMRAQGAITVLASGGFTLFTAHVAQQVGFDRHLANSLDIEAARLTGVLKEPIFGRAAKRAALIALRQEFGLAPEATLAAGDGANDLAMLEEAGLGVAFRAKPAVAAVAHARIDHGDLTALLYLQGYEDADFVT